MEHPDGNWSGWGNHSSYRTQIHGVHEVLAYVEAISSPLVCLVGTLLNLMAMGAFLSKPLRRISCCLYLATRSFAVFGFLVSMATAWSNTFTTFIGTEGICEMTIFLSYFCPFLSVWMVVVISLENFIRIAQPSRVQSLCNPRVAQSVIAIFCIMGLAVYNFPLWTSRVIDGECRVLLQYVQIVLILNYVDTALTLLAPFALLIVLVPLVALSAIHAYDRKKRLAAGRSIRPGGQDVKSTPEARVTHLLLAVSVVFLMLHTPFHAIRIKYFILTLAGAQEQITETDQILHQVFRLFYNLDSCVSCAVYLIFGDNFRRVFYNMYFSRCHRGWCRLRHNVRNAQQVVVTSFNTDHTAIEISTVVPSLESTPKFRGGNNSSTTTTTAMTVLSQQQCYGSQLLVDNSNFHRKHSNNNSVSSRSGSYISVTNDNDDVNVDGGDKNCSGGDGGGSVGCNDLYYNQIRSNGYGGVSSTSTTNENVPDNDSLTAARSLSRLPLLSPEDKDCMVIKDDGDGGEAHPSSHTVARVNLSSCYDNCNIIDDESTSLIQRNESVVLLDMDNNNHDNDDDDDDVKVDMGCVDDDDDDDEEEEEEEEGDLLCAEDEEKQTKRGLLSTESVDV